MIEISLIDVWNGFRVQTALFLEQPTVSNGIELDDATVKLKRVLLSQQPDHPAIGILNQFMRLIRQKDVDGIKGHLDDLQDHFN